jgi:prolyl-tRNA synthetase
MDVAIQIKQELLAAGIRLKMDDREELTPGFKFNDWEMRGVPLRIEIGPKDVENGSVALARRDRPGREGKSSVSQTGLATTVLALLDEIQDSLLVRATEFRDSHIAEPKTFDDLREIVKSGWALAWWCEDAECEAKVKQETRATNRCIPLEQPGGEGECVVCGRPAKVKAYFGRAY